MEPGRGGGDWLGDRGRQASIQWRDEMSVLNSLQMNLLEANILEGYKDRTTYLAPVVKQNDFLQVAPWVASTDGNMNKTTQVVELGKGAWSRIHAPITEIGAKSEVIVENLKLFEALSNVDERLLTGKRKVKIRDAQDVANLEGFTQSWLHELLYNTDAKDGTLGLFARRASLPKGGKFNGVYNAGGTAGGSLTSALLVEFGDVGMQLVYEDGERPGITDEDKGEVYVDGYYALQRLFRIKGAIAIHKPESVIRLANIDPTKSLDWKVFVSLRNKLPSMGRNAALFVNRDVKTMLETYCLEKNNAQYSYGELQGYGQVARVMGIPVMMLEAIDSNEAVVA